MITQEFDLNLIPNMAPVVVDVDQYDVGTGRLVISLYKNDLPYTPTSATATIQGRKPDGHGFAYAASLSGNTVTADLTEQMTPVAGDVRTQVVIHETNGRTGTFAFILRVQDSALPDDTDLSDSDYQLIEQGIEAAEDAENSADIAKSWAVGPSAMETSGTDTNNAKYWAQNAHGDGENAEAWAVGQRDGVDVPSTDPTYHNNAKYYAEESGNEAKDSEAWAVGKRNGMDVGGSDPTYHNNSKYYAGNANTSATSAELSAQSASASASNSEAYAVGKRVGVDVPPTDATYHNNSKYYSDLAGTSETNAATSEQAAKLSEQNAAASEDILRFYVDFVVPRFVIQNNRLYINDPAIGEFLVANNRLYFRAATT